jgi:hypothetical protein
MRNLSGAESLGIEFKDLPGSFKLLGISGLPARLEG